MLLDMVPTYGLHLWSSYPFHYTCKNGHLCGVREEKRHIWHTCANIQRLKKEYSSNDDNPLVFGFCGWGGARITRWLINQMYQDIACEGWHKLYLKGDFALEDVGFQLQQHEALSPNVSWEQCWILKSSTPVKCSLDVKKVFVFFLFLGHFANLCYAKFPPFTVQASPEIACHKI